MQHQAIRSIQTVSSPFLSIEVPKNFQGKKVEVLITPLDEEKETELERLARHAKQKPPLPPDLQKRLADDPSMLERSVVHYDDPYGPACSPEDWEANS